MRKRRMFMESQLGQTVNVLFEQQKDTGWSGHTDNYMQVMVEAPNQDLANCNRQVHLQKVKGSAIIGALA